MAGAFYCQIWSTNEQKSLVSMCFWFLSHVFQPNRFFSLITTLLAARFSGFFWLPYALQSPFPVIVTSSNPNWKQLVGFKQKWRHRIFASPLLQAERVPSITHCMGQVFSKAPSIWALMISQKLRNLQGCQWRTWVMERMGSIQPLDHKSTVRGHWKTNNRSFNVFWTTL